MDLIRVSLVEPPRALALPTFSSDVRKESLGLFGLSIHQSVGPRAGDPPRNRGVDPLPARIDHDAMDSLNPSPQSPPPRGADLEARLQAWIQLRDQMRNVEAQLEYVRLMLKMGVRPGSSR